MSQTITIQTEKPIITASIFEEKNLLADLKTKKGDFLEVSRTLEGVVNKLNQFYEQLVAQNSEKVAQLSVAIARKIKWRQNLIPAAWVSVPYPPTKLLS